jgi:hypothetical protein
VRELVYDAVADTREVIGELLGEARKGNLLTDDEVLAQYEPMRGDVQAVIGFAARRVGPRGDVLGEAVEYERKMEALRRSRV